MEKVMGQGKDRDISYLLPSQEKNQTKTKQNKPTWLGKNLFILIDTRAAWQETEINTKDLSLPLPLENFLKRYFKISAKTETHDTSQSRTCWSPERHQDQQQKHPQHAED